MTIQIIRRASLGLEPGAIRTFDASTEAALIADKEAISAPSPNPAGDEEAVRYDPTTGNLIGARGQILSSVSEDRLSVAEVALARFVALERAAQDAAYDSGGYLWYGWAGANTNSDGSGSAIKTAGQPIGRILNQEGNAALYAVQATAGNKPTSILLANGRKAWSFDGSDHLAAAATVISASLTDPYSQIAAFVAPASMASRLHIQGDAARGLVTSNGSRFGVAQTGSQLDADLLTSGTPYVGSAIYAGSGGLMSMWTNGVAKTPTVVASPSSGTTTSWYIGQRGIGSEYYTGVIALSFAAPGVITTEQRQAIERFAAYYVGANYVG